MFSPYLEFKQYSLTSSTIEFFCTGTVIDCNDFVKKFFFACVGAQLSRRLVVPAPSCPGAQLSLRPVGPAPSWRRLHDGAELAAPKCPDSLPFQPCEGMGQYDTVQGQ